MPPGCDNDHARGTVLCRVVCDCVCFLQAESSNAELTLLVNKLRSEEAGLRDSLAKMGSLNEGLAQDKSDLNNIINQVCVWAYQAITCRRRICSVSLSRLTPP